MNDLTIHHLWFTVAAVTPLSLPDESGSAIRGALITSLRQHYCPDATLRPVSADARSDAAHRSICPVCWLIAEEDSEATRGRNIPRPYTIEPPSGGNRRFEPGQEFSFGMSLIGKAINLFPYLVLALPEMGRTGMGQYDPRQGGRGKFTLRSVFAVNPLSGARQPLLSGGTHLQLPATPVTSAQVLAVAAEQLERANRRENSIAIHFRTPTRIISGSHLVRRPAFEPFFQRLVERVGLLGQYYGTPAQNEAALAKERLLACADAVEIVEDHTEWVEAMSGSKRLGRSTPVSGYVGRVRFRSEHWSELLPWLAWGQSVHVGKSAVKGNGWFIVDGWPGWPLVAKALDRGPGVGTED